MDERAEAQRARLATAVKRRAAGVIRAEDGVIGRRFVTDENGDYDGEGSRCVFHNFFLPYNVRTRQVLFLAVGHYGALMPPSRRPALPAQLNCPLTPRGSQGASLGMPALDRARWTRATCPTLGGPLGARCAGFLGRRLADRIPYDQPRCVALVC